MQSDGFPSGVIEMPSGDRRTLVRAVTLLVSTVAAAEGCSICVSRRWTEVPSIWLLPGSRSCTEECYLSVLLGWPESDDADRPVDTLRVSTAICDLLAADGWQDATAGSWTASRWCDDPPLAARLIVNTLELVLQMPMHDLVWQGLVS